MKTIIWEFNDLKLPAIEDDNGELWFTTTALCGALRVKKKTADQCWTRNKEEFESLRSTFCGPKENLVVYAACNKEVFGIKRIRDDLNFYNEDEMLTFAFHLKSQHALEFRTQFRKMIKEHRTKTSVPRNEYEAVLQFYEKRISEIEDKYEALESLVTNSVSGIDKMASSFGHGLNACKKVKEIRKTIH